MTSLAITRAFSEAREVLAVPRDAEPQAVRRAYRRAVAASPPDRDPEGFRRIREAYELLADPLSRADKALLHPVPHLPPPPLPDLPAAHALGSVPVELLRAVLGQISRDKLLGSGTEKKRSQP